MPVAVATQRPSPVTFLAASRFALAVPPAFLFRTNYRATGFRFIGLGFQVAGGLSQIPISG